MKKWISKLWVVKCFINYFIFCFCCYQNYIAQSNVKANEKSFNLPNEFGTILNFAPYPKTYLYENIDESKAGAPLLRSETYFIAIPPNTKVNIKINEQKYFTTSIPYIEINPKVVLEHDSTMSYKKVGLSKDYFYENETYPANELIINGYTWIRGYYCAVVTINIDRYNWKNKNLSSLLSAKLNIKYYETTNNINLISEKIFDSVAKKLIINYDYAKSYKTNIVMQVDDSLSKWIDYSQEYVKLKIPQDGIYRIYYNDMKEYGIEPSFIDIRKLKLFQKGKQIPLYINDGGDNSFDKKDYIEFYCEKNYGSQDYEKIVSIGQDYKNYYDRYTDTAIVWLSWEGDDGKRIEVLPIVRRVEKNNNQLVSDTIKYGFCKLHLEDDNRLWYYDATEPRVQLPFWQENKVWTWLVVGNSGYQSINFNANHFVPNSKINTIVRLISNAADEQQYAHKIGVSLNSTNVQDTIVFDYRKILNFTSEFNPKELIEGTNTLRIFGLQSKASFHQVLIDWVDINYYRYNYAIDDSIKIIIADSLSKEKRTLLIQNINVSPSNLLVYKIKSELKKIENFYLNEEIKTLLFNDIVSTNDVYLITKSEKILKPIFECKKRFKNLRNTSRGADYVIISSKELKTSAQSYRDFIADEYKLRTELVFVDDIYDEFSFGNPSAESIREFLKWAFNNWTPPKPIYLLLIGDANYDYKNKLNPAPNPRKKNLVPSYGFPVSDSWFVTWDNNLPVPQMFVGRIPAENDQQVFFYLNKHRTYLNRNYDNWNKSFLFFSGGDASKISQLNQIKEVNDSLYNLFINRPPIGGIGKHFYKTSEPKTNFGPYAYEEIQKAIDEGGIFISYVGHSGTQTWDNGITKVEDIMNNYSDRYPLITDFGCSTGKFAEPDINSFAEEFINLNNNGQAIVYLGNSSWGYLSTSLRFPLLFYQNFLSDTLLSIGQIHWLSKLKQYVKFGISDVNKVFTYCNNLIGDPIIALKIPTKPNLYIKDNLTRQTSMISTEEIFPNNSTDSLKVKIKYFNYGRVNAQKFKILIEHYYSGNLIEKHIIDNYLPDYEKNIELFVLNKPGLHELKCTLDYNNEIEESNEEDNIATYSFIVSSQSLRVLSADNFYNGNLDTIKILNPVVKNKSEKINLTFSDSPNFQNRYDYTISFETLITSFPIPDIFMHKRTWFKIKSSDSDNWSEIYSFKENPFNAKWFIDTLISRDYTSMKNIQYDSLINGWRLTKNKNKLKIISAGQTAGSFSSIQFNQIEKLPNTYFWGIAAAIIDSITFEPLSIKYFLYPANTSGIELKNFIDTLKVGTLVALSICDDGAQSVLGFSKGSEARKAIETLGSKYIDSVKYRESWCMLGKKGAKVGTVYESYKKLYEGLATLEIEKEVTADSGYFLTPPIKNISSIEKIFCDAEMPNLIDKLNTKLKVIPLAYSNENNVDTLKELYFKNKSISQTYLTSQINIEEKKYTSLKFLNKFYADENKNSPILHSIGVTHKTLPELAINYQVVSINKDTIEQGDELRFSFYIYNVGESIAKNFNVIVNLNDNKNNLVKIYERSLDSLSANESKLFDLSLNTSKLYGENKLEIIIDPENKIHELYEDNNYYTITFNIKQNTQPQSISIYFDGIDIIDGDYVSAKPEIRIELFDPSFLMIEDTTALQIFLNDKLISFSSNPDILNYSFSNTNPKMVVNYKPELEDGEYTLKVVAPNSFSIANIKPQLVKKFVVESEAKLLNVYNFPNPFSKETYFTFKLTQIPDELRIKIFTVYGRLIKEIKLDSHELNYDFNRVYWDGRDEEGNLLANGVYLYKIIMKKGNELKSAIQKLAIVK